MLAPWVGRNPEQPRRHPHRTTRSTVGRRSAQVNAAAPGHVRSTSSRRTAACPEAATIAAAGWYRGGARQMRTRHSRRWTTAWSSPWWPAPLPAAETHRRRPARPPPARQRHPPAHRGGAGRRTGRTGGLRRLSRRLPRGEPGQRPPPPGTDPVPGRPAAHPGPGGHRRHPPTRRGTHRDAQVRTHRHRRQPGRRTRRPWRSRTAWTPPATGWSMPRTSGWCPVPAEAGTWRPPPRPATRTAGG